MKKRLLIWLLILLGIGPVMGQVYQVGDLYTAPDGSQGIVFYVHPDGSGGWIVALNDASSGCKWGPNVNVPELDNQNPTYRQLLLGDIDGYANTVAMRSTTLASGGGTYASTVVDLAREWVVPSPAQLRVLYGQLSVVSPALIAAGGQDMARANYWTSAERNYQYAWYIDFGEAAYAGSFMNALKSSEYRVREVRSFTILTIDYDTTLTYAWNTGATTPYIVVAPTETANYTVTATSAYGCSNTATQTVTVANDAPVTLYDVTCQGAGYNRNGFELSAEETAEVGELVRERYESVSFCTTPVTLHLTVNPSYNQSETESICENELPFSWRDTTFQVGTVSGDCVFHRQTAMGCDSVVTLHLTIHEMPDVSISGRVDIVEGGIDTFTVALSGVTHYEWYIGGNLIMEETLLSNETSRIFTDAPSSTTTYTVIGTANGCADTASITVNVAQCESWQLVTDASQLAVGDKIVITNSDATYVLSTTQQTNNFRAKPISHIGNTLVFNDDAQIITIEQGTVNNTYALHVDDGYLYAASSTNNQLKKQTTNNANGSWKIEIVPSGIATIKAQGTNSRNWLRFHVPGGGTDSIYLFSCYSSGQNDISIYKRTSLRSETDTTVISCSGYYWRGNSYAEDGDYSDTLTNSVGCDSIITLHLTVLHENAATVTFDPCNGTCDTSSLTEEDCQSGVILPIATPCAEGYTFEGWTTMSVDAPTPILPSPLFGAGDFFNPSSDTTLYAVYRKCMHGKTVYRKVTASLSDWSGNYLIVYTDGNLIFDGSLATLDATNNYQTVSITNDTIPATGNLAKSFTITQTGSNCTIRSASGKYIGNTNNSNYLEEGDTLYTNSILYNNGNIDIKSSGGAYLRFNAASNQMRFRYFKSGTYTAQKAIQLYKYENLITCEYTSYPFYPSSSLTESVCETYTWTSGNGETYTESGTYYFEHSNANGCPQVDTLYLTVLHENAATVTFVPGNGYCASTSLTEENCQSGLSLPAAIPCSADYVFAGWSTTAVDTNTTTTPTQLYAAGTNYNPSEDTTLYAVYKKCTSSDTVFRCVTNDLGDWSGEYLIASTGGHTILNGAQSPVSNGINNYIGSISIDNTNNRILSIDNPGINLASSTFIINPLGSNYYSICSKSGYYIGNTSNSNSIETSNTTPFNNTITYSNNSNHDINISCNGRVLQTFNTSGVAYKYYGDVRHPIQLYRLELDEDCEYTTFPPNPSRDTSAIACRSYTWHGHTYTESGDYNDTLTNALGCDSVVTLHLTIKKSSGSDTTVITCGAFEWHGQTYTESGNYKDTLTNAAGCDSIITLHLSITEVNVSIIASADTICAGEVDTLWIERVSSIAIGDILCTDNSFVKPVDWEDAAAMGKVALGIVFYVDNTGEHGWAVHLHNSTSPKRWTLSPYNTDIHPLFNYPNAREAIKDLDGYTNTQRIRSASNNTQYPADAYPAVYAVDFEHGWYLPAAGQLRLLFAERHTINASLEAVSHTQQGVTPIADTFQYWSSTECNRDEAWGVTNSLGWVRNTSKNEYNRTCSVRNF